VTSCDCSSVAHLRFKKVDGQLAMMGVAWHCWGTSETIGIP
jgi:hypothetical protein